MAVSGRGVRRRALIGAPLGAVALGLAGTRLGGALPAGTPAPLAVALRVDARGPGRPISPLIYGVAHAGAEALGATGARLHRWGGNPNSRYNWEHGSAWNAARDWEFRNYGQDAPPAEPAASSAADRYVELNRALGVTTYLTVPALGWVALNADNATRSVGVPAAGGAAAGYDPTGNRITTSVPSRARKRDAYDALPDSADGVVSQDEWIAHLVRRFGQAATGGVRYYVVDNEPDLWADTHTDVHPERPGYDELLTTFLEYAAAIKDVDGGALVAGPALSGWQALFDSPRHAAAAAGLLARSARRLLPGAPELAARALPDRQAHGGEPFLPWWLSQVRRDDERAGRRTLDVLDVHFYPQGPAIYSDRDDPATSALRLRSTRALWDATYVDEFWIGQPVRLLPRLREWIERCYPGTALAIGEWSWGAEQTMSGALAVADVLGIFGREGVDIAAYWTVPPVGSPAALAFALYTNHDGQGGAFGDRSLPATSSSPDEVTVYASKDTRSGDLVVLAVNQHPEAAAAAALAFQGESPSGSLRVFRLAAERAAVIREAASVPLSDGTATITLPPYSATLLRVRPS